MDTRPLPDHRGVTRPEALTALRLAALGALVDFLEARLEAGPVAAPSRLEDLSLLHLAKATGTTASALSLIADRRWPDACILARAVFEQLFIYLWVVQDPQKAEARSTMVTIKQEWANAKYLEGLAANAGPAAEPELLAEAARYRAVAEGMLEALATALGTTEKKVRDEATKRVSLKAIEVNLGPAFSLPYAHYSGFVHSDGNALAAYGAASPGGRRYGSRGLAPVALPVARDLHRALLRLAGEVLTRCPRLAWPGAGAYFEAHAAWLAAVDAQDDFPLAAERET
ncbi:MAG: DUF5677 domain-containing protein [Candidatus Sericytochromatia bacterium]